ncbi:MAG: hypothetical protein ACKVZJ_08080 [Phycisphaerales bacterium]
MPRRDPRFLCESCGYDLSDRAAEAVDSASAFSGGEAEALLDAPCPECGQRIGDSHPSRRPGSPWQRRGSGVLAGVRAWVATVGEVATSPRVCWAGFAPDVRRSLGFLVVTSGVGAAIPALGLFYSRFSGISPRPGYVGGFFLTGWLLMLSMSLVEFMGIRFFGSRRGWRVDAAVAACVVSHAAVGWLACGVLVALAWQLSNALVWSGRVSIYAVTTPTPVQTNVVALAIALLAGIVSYETLVFFGVRRMKFANAPRG